MLYSRTAEKAVKDADKKLERQSSNPVRGSGINMSYC